MSIVQRLMETTTGAYGEETNCFDADLASEVEDAWRAKYGKDIEESLNISGYDVSRIFALVPDILIRWEWPVDVEALT